MVDPTLHAGRRHRLAAEMRRGVAIVRTAPERARNRDSGYPYRFDSYFYYLTGFPEPEAVLVLVAGEKPKSLLFCREKNLEREIWDGFRYGPEKAREAFGFDEAHPIEKLDELIPGLLADQPAVYCDVGSDPEWDARVIGWINKVRERLRSGVAAPAEIRDVRRALDEMRLVKDAAELDTMRHAARISSQAHERAMRATRPGLHEYEVEAELIHEFRRHGAQAPAYTPIVAGGANACVLHYVQNDALLRDGDLLLIDAGCELDYYASDVTRTLPVGGRYARRQRAVYEVVLEAQQAAIAKVRAGAHWNEPHQAAVRAITQGLVRIGLLKGRVPKLIRDAAYRPFFMHRVGHWLGMDVHDVGEYKVGDAWRLLEPGMVTTIEPGIYIAPGTKGVRREWWGIGVRIEDDVAVTGGKPEVLTAAMPTDPDEIERLMAAA
jgi:Xaa-Pro aminopeptidase